jgi:hypothetical protein
VSGELELTPIEQINAEHHACEAAVRSALKHAVRCGTLLEEQKATVNHGGWLMWLEENFDGSVRTAQIYMKLSRGREAVEEAANAQSSAHLSIDGALRALDAPKEPDEPEDSVPLENHKRKANHHAEELRAEELREQLKKARQRAERERERRERAEREANKRKEDIVSKIEGQFIEEMADLKAKYGKEDEPTFAEIPPEQWQQALKNAKSQRVMDVTKRLNEMYAWPEWMGAYFPDEAAAAIADMERKESLIEGIDFILHWLGRVREELEEDE